ncbi:MAG: efflux RND transporter periplasmic adaptor subunit [Salinivirgaceae bacterium]|nr:efflux RND transporter periplasmic adaptor subunit [Salinivirgaceae bacterium]
MKKFFKILALIFVIVLFVGTIVFLAGKTKKEPEVYNIEKPQKTNIVNQTMATGSIVPRKEIPIKPQVSGIVQEIYFEAGSMVKEGQVIAKVKIIPDVQSLNSAESQVKMQKLNLDNETINYNRQKQLYERKVISEQEFQQAELSYNQAVENYNNAQSNLEIIKDGVSKKAQNTTNTLIRSTINGMIIDVPIKEGNSVTQSNTFNDGTTIAVVADMGDMIFEGKIDETEVGKIHEGMHLDLTIGAIIDTHFDAVLEYISPKGVEQNGAVQFDIKAKVQLQDGVFIRSGYSANANIILERHDSVMAISEGLLFFENDSSFVNVLVSDSTEVPQRFERRFVEIGSSDGINIEIKNGLDWNDKLKGNAVIK